MKTLRIVRALPAVALSVAVLAACSSPPSDASGDLGSGAGGETDPVALIRAVSRQVEALDSMRMTFDMSIDAQGQTISATGDGEFSTDPLAMHATYRFGELPGMPAGAEMELILDGSTFYLRMPDLAGAQGLPTEWVSMDIDEVAPGFDSLVALSQGQNDPTSSFAYLKGITDAEVVGTETVAGFETTHYRGSADMQEALDRLSAEADADARQALAQARKIMGTADVPIDVWIDEDGLVRRMSFSMEASAGAAGAFSMRMNMEISEYDIDVELPIPAADDVTDLGQVMAGGDY